MSAGTGGPGILAKIPVGAVRIGCCRQDMWHNFCNRVRVTKDGRLAQFRTRTSRPLPLRTAADQPFHEFFHQHPGRPVHHGAQDRDGRRRSCNPEGHRETARARPRGDRTCHRRPGRCGQDRDGGLHRSAHRARQPENLSRIHRIDGHRQPASGRRRRLGAVEQPRLSADHAAGSARHRRRGQISPARRHHGPPLTPFGARDPGRRLQAGSQ